MQWRNGGGAGRVLAPGASTIGAPKWIPRLKYTELITVISDYIIIIYSFSICDVSLKLPLAYAERDDTKVFRQKT
jgi:hypothetical protein